MSIPTIRPSRTTTDSVGPALLVVLDTLAPDVTLGQLDVVRELVDGATGE